MAEQVLGDWNEFTFQPATMEDFPEVAQNVRDYFLRDEQMNVYLGWSEDNAKNHDDMVRIALSHNASFLVRHRETGEVSFSKMIK